MITFVTAFLEVYEDRSKNKPVDGCFEHFQKLAATGIRLHVFLSYRFADKMPDLSNVVVEYLELDDLDTYKALQDISYSIPPSNTPHKDNGRFMILMNAKVEMVARVIRKGGATHYSWIDFSIFHVISNIPAVSKYLKILSGSDLPSPYMAFPGCWSKGDRIGALFTDINWRFCGGFFIGDADSLIALHTLYQNEFPEIVREKGVLIWEVNIWHYFEIMHGIHLGWYKADHNDSIIMAPLSTS